MTFTDAEIMALKPGRDGPRFNTGCDGLYLYLYKTGVRSWRFETCQGKIRRTVTIGHWPEYDLEKAKKALEFYRKQIAIGYTPKEIREGLKAIPDNPELRIVKMRDGRTLVLCTAEGDKQAELASELETSIALSNTPSETSEQLHRSLYFAYEAWKLKRDFNK